MTKGTVLTVRKSYALFKDGAQVSKWHSSKRVAFVEAYERGAVVSWGADFENDTPGVSLAEGYEVKGANDE